MNQLSLRTKGLFIIIIISLVPLMLAGLYNYVTVRQGMVQNEIDKIILKQENRAFIINAWIDNRIAELLVMSRSDAISSNNESEIVNYLNMEQNSNQFYYDEIGFFDMQRKITGTQRKNVTPNEMRIFLSASKGKPIVSDPISTLYFQYPVGYFAAPIYSEEAKVKGVIYALYQFRPTEFEKIVQAEDDDFYLYSDTGDLLFSHLSKNMSSQLQESLHAELEKIAISQANYDSGNLYVNVKSDKYIIFYQHIKNSNWMIIEVKDLAELQAIASPTLWRILVTNSLVVCIIAIIFYIYFESIISRLQDIFRVTKLAAEGTFDAEHLNAYSGDEIGDLANSVNGMMGRLQVMFDRLDSVINQNKSPVLVMDERYIITYLNKAAEDLLGYTFDEIVGKASPLLFMDLDEVKIHAEKLSEQLGRQIQPGVELFLELGKHYPKYDFEMSIFNRDGKRVPVYNRSSSLKDRSGKFAGTIAIVNDLSEQRELETVRNRLQLIVESAMDLISSVDQHANIIYINEAGRKILGIEQEDWEFKPIAEFLPDYMYRLLVKGCIKARKKGHFEIDAQFENIKGKHINVSIVIVAHTDAYTGELMYSCISRDITEHVELQQQLVQATQAAEDASRAKSNFLALMSHEIRTPLNGIIGLSQLLQKTELDALQREYVQRTKDSSDMLLHIVTDILDFSKLEVNKIEPDFTTFQIRDMLNHLADQLSVFIGGKDQFDFKIEICSKVPINLIGDVMRLEQVLSNLCVNAIKFTKQGLVELNIDLLDEDKEEIILQFTVKDTGIGMTEEQLQHLFKPFTQADSSTTRKYGGTGLGLVISQSLVEILGGQLNVESQYAVGSTFSFHLPFKKVGYQFENEQSEPLEKQDELVWMVEDNNAMAAYWNRLFSSQQYSAVRMKSWKQAYYRLLRLGEGAYPSFIMLDMEMNDMYGIETWLDFRKEANSRGISIIAITTAYGREELLMLDNSDQPERILTKPVTEMRFVEAINNYMLREQDSAPLTDKIDSTTADLYTHAREIKVLLAEDNKVNQLVAVEMLKLCHCHVTVANNGIEALTCMQESDYDLIIMDIHMPEMDGMEAVQIIRSNPKYETLPIIALTANIVQSDHERYLSMGMNKVLTKPVSMNQLQNVLQAYVEVASSASMNRVQEQLEHNDIQLYNYLMQLTVVQAKEALERLNGKLHIYVHMLEQFYQDYEDFTIRIENYLKLEQYEELGRALHTLKGAASYLAAERLYQLAVNGEQLVLQKKLEALSQFIIDLDQEMIMYKVEIIELLREINTI